MVRPGLPPLAELERLGVRRVSFGPSASYAALGLLRRASEEVRSQGTYALLTEGALTFDELNRLAGPRAPAPS
jgi:2-methylisocitrate lyase-like PEP mutase family enzyme